MFVSGLWSEWGHDTHIFNGHLFTLTKGLLSWSQSLEENEIIESSFVRFERGKHFHDKGLRKRFISVINMGEDAELHHERVEVVVLVQSHCVEHAQWTWVGFQSRQLIIDCIVKEKVWEKNRITKLQIKIQKNEFLLISHQSTNGLGKLLYYKKISYLF